MSIASEIQRIKTAKENITRALSRKGIQIPEGSTLDDFAEIIDPITGGEELSWEDNPDGYLSFKFITNGSVRWQNAKGDIQYSKDAGDTWTSFNGSIVSCISGDEIWFKGDLTNGCGDDKEYNSSKFYTVGNFFASGNVQSLCNFNNTLKQYHFAYLFSKCIGLNISSEKQLLLPATTLANWCYRSMFSSCTSLTTSPELPATTLAEGCYYSMFYKCANITTTPILSATTLVKLCYGGMFTGCTSLTTAPVLPATTLETSCYYCMFTGCTSLITSPELPATTLANRCYYQMFTDCISLITSPILPATTLVEQCYTSMFNGCTSLNYIKCLATDISATGCLNSWVTNVSSSGTFVKDPSMNDWPSDQNGIPSGWTVQNAA